MESSLQNNKGMTFIEMLVVIAIISILFASFFYIWNTMDIFRKSRDSKRINDLQLLDTALKTLLSTERNINLGEENVIYTSLPDSSSTCGSYNLIPLFSPYSYRCQTSQNYLKVDGNGWLPVNFTLGKILMVSVLPIDPLNNKDYFYAYQVRQGRYKLTARFETQTNISKMANDGGFEPTLYEVGSDLFIPSPHSGLVGYWSFDEGTGTIAYDLSGYGNNGTLLDASSTNADGNTPPQWTTGKIGKALIFDGVDDYVSMGNKFNMGTTQDFTLVAWVKVNALQASSQGVVGKLPWSCGGYGIEIYPNGTIYGNLKTQTASACGCSLSRSSASSPLNEWYFLANTIKRNDKNSLYFNGNLSTSGSISSLYGCSVDNSFNFTVGAPPGSGGNYFNGLIDEVRVYNRALSDSEIKALYDATK
jgi:prepilin-type N-terminal cleavage/methylation domain-containing protein